MKLEQETNLPDLSPPKWMQLQQKIKFSMVVFVRILTLQ